MRQVHGLHLETRGRSNPYLSQSGFWKRVEYAAGALSSLAMNPSNRTPVQARGFDQCFAMRDGNAVIWELVNRVREGDQLLERGIANLSPTIWDDWVEIYEMHTRIETNLESSLARHKELRTLNTHSAAVL